jgi:hypothetical protein
VVAGLLLQQVRSVIVKFRSSERDAAERTSTNRNTRAIQSMINSSASRVVPLSKDVGVQRHDDATAGATVPTPTGAFG